MFVLVGALLLFEVVLGAVVHVPLPVAVVAGVVIAGWLAIYAQRKRHARTMTSTVTSTATTREEGGR